MKKLFSVLLLSLALFSFAMPTPALAAGDAAKGASVFTANCNACHIGGKNAIMPMKTLDKAALAKYLKGFSDGAEAAVAYQVTNGKGGMPSFRGRLNAEQIENVSAYVVAQAEKGW